MQTVNILQAKSTLSKLVEAIESGSEEEVIIARNGRPAAKLVPMESVGHGQRIGLAKGRFIAPTSIDISNEQIAALFTGQV
jgi:antitoxin (DNA-binding transcriptional repressor) of toxin-antitoxin stability system